MNRLVNTTRYIYAILSGIPIGIVLFFFGINGVTLNESDLHKLTGIVNELKQEDNIIFLKLNNESNYYHTGIPERVEVILDNINLGDKITIYRIKNNDGLFYIEKLTKGDETIIAFNKALLIPFISLVLGVIIITVGIVYLVRNFSDLFGGNKEKMEHFLDPWRKNKY